MALKTFSRERGRYLDFPLASSQKKAVCIAENFPGPRETCKKMRRIILLLCLFCARRISAQDLAPRAYVITPLHANAVTLTYSLFDGSLLFDGEAPITGASARVNVSIFSAYHSFNFFGRTASFLVSLPYLNGNFHGTVLGAE